MHVRKITTLVILGLLVGIGCGVGALSLRRRGVPVPFLPATPSPLGANPIMEFRATCIGGTTPRVFLLWKGGSGADVITVERAPDTRPWVSLSKIDADSHTYTDTRIMSGASYSYRLTFQGAVVSDEAPVTIRADGCGQ